MKFSTLRLRGKLLRIITEIIVYLVLLEVGLRVGGGIFLYFQEHRGARQRFDQNEYRIICIGESITALGGLYAYPDQLEQVLNEKGLGVHFTVFNKGLPGVNTSDIIAKLPYNLDTYRPHLVVAMMGTSDWKGLAAFDDAKPAQTSILGRLAVYKLFSRLIEAAGGGWRRGASVQTGVIEGDIPRGRQSPVVKADYATLDDVMDALTKMKHDQDYRSAESLLLDAMHRFPLESAVPAELGWVYSEQDRNDLAETNFLKAVSLNNEDSRAIAGLAWCCNGRGEYVKAGRLYEQAVTIDPSNDKAYVGWALCVRNQDKHELAERLFKKAIETNPANSYAYFELAWLYCNKDWLHLDLAEQMYEKAIEIDPRSALYRLYLGWFYQRTGRLDMAEALYKAALAIAPYDVKTMLSLAALYKEQGNARLCKEYEDKAEAIRHSFYSIITKNNFFRLKEETGRRGIALVCAGYPMRSIEPLKMLFENNDKGIVFVDNEKIFKDAVARDGYDAYFVDMIQGDFGHGSHRGNRLIAETVAEAIVNNFFKDKQ